MNILLTQLWATARRYPLAATGLVLFILFGGANYFLWQQDKEITARHDAARRDGEAMLFALSSQPRVASELLAVQEALKVIDRNLIVEADLPTNLGYFYQLETQCHVRLSQLNQLSSQPPPEGNPYKAVPFSLRVNGTYPQIMNFLRQLESGPRLLRVRTYNFSRVDATNSAMALDLVVEILSS